MNLCIQCLSVLVQFCLIQSIQSILCTVNHPLNNSHVWKTLYVNMKLILLQTCFEFQNFRFHEWVLALALCTLIDTLPMDRQLIHVFEQSSEKPHKWYPPKYGRPLFAKSSRHISRLSRAAPGTFSTWWILIVSSSIIIAKIFENMCDSDSSHEFHYTQLTFG